MINTTFKLGSLHIYSVIFAIWIMFFDTVSAQIADAVNDKSIFRGVGGLTVGGTAQDWTITGLGTISQQSAPVSISLPLANRLLFSGATSGMHASTTAKGNFSLSSIADTRLSLSYVLPGDKVWLTAGLSLPTGKTKLDTSELKMASLTSQTAFNFKVPSFGQGVSSNFGMVYAGTITRRLVIGVGASYNFKGEYEPLNISSKPKYNPGDEISTNLAFNYLTYSKESRISMDLTGTYFLKDEIDGQVKYHSGSRLIGLIAYSLKSGKYNHLVQTRIRYHLENTSYGTNTINYKASSQIEYQYSLSTQINEWLNGAVVGEYKSYGTDQTIIGGNLVETGKAGIVSFGCEAGFLFTDILFPTVSLRYSTGSLTYEGVNYTVNGIEAGVAVKISF